MWRVRGRRFLEEGGTGGSRGLRGLFPSWLKERSGGWKVFGCSRRVGGGDVGCLDFASSFPFFFSFLARRVSYEASSVLDNLRFGM